MKIWFLTLSAALAAGCASSPESASSGASGSGALRATLGATTSVPDAEVVRAMELPFNVRQMGRVVDAVEPGSGAAAAGIRPGDVLLSLDEVDLYSQDDIDDVLRVSHPGQDVTLRIKRAGSAQEELLVAKLGSLRADPRGGIGWRYASLANLPKALEAARAAQKKVLVGLSGAET